MLVKQNYQWQRPEAEARPGHTGPDQASSGKGAAGLQEVGNMQGSNGVMMMPASNGVMMLPASNCNWQTMGCFPGQLLAEIIATCNRTVKYMLV